MKWLISISSIAATLGFWYVFSEQVESELDPIVNPGQARNVVEATFVPDRQREALSAQPDVSKFSSTEPPPVPTPFRIIVHDANQPKPTVVTHSSR